jgi:hypothetical protein
MAFAMSVAKYSNKLKLIKRVWDERSTIRKVWDERSTIRRILESGSYQSLKFAAPGHYASPIPDIKKIHARSDIVYDRSPTVIAGIDVNVKAQTELAHEFVTYYKDIPFPEKKQDGYRYYFDNSYFSYGDGVVLYSMLRQFKPKRVIEVGSGFSSAAMLDVNEKFCNGEIDFTFIEPSPDRLLSLLGNQDTERCNIVRAPVQEVPTRLFADLHENDILFVDSSHVAKTDSDVVHLLFHILPSLNRGVILHFHDTLWPFEYPSLWHDIGRAWNEAYFLRAFLQYNGAFRILYFNSMMEIHQGQFLRCEMPLAMKRPSAPLTPGNASLWIRKIQ